MIVIPSPSPSDPNIPVRFHSRPISWTLFRNTRLSTSYRIVKYDMLSIFFNHTVIIIPFPH